MDVEGMEPAGREPRGELGELGEIMMRRSHAALLAITLSGVVGYLALGEGIEIGEARAPAAAEARHMADLQRTGATLDICIRGLVHAHAEADSIDRALEHFEWPRQ